MKKFLLLILVLALTLSTFAACSKTEENKPEGTTTAGTTAETEGTTAGEETSGEETSGEETSVEDTSEGTSEETSEDTTDDIPDEPTAAEEAMAYIHQLYKDNIAQTVANYDLVKSVTIGDETFAVVWTIVGTEEVTIVDKDDTMVTVVVPDQGDTDIPYTIKATITSGEEVVSREYERVVPKLAVNTHEEYMAAKQDDVLTIEGIVVAMNAKSVGNTRNHLFIADANVVGGYYIYQMEADPIESGIQVGMTVRVTGPMSPYSGMQEIKGGQAKIVDTTIKTVDVLDITEKFAAGENIASYVGLPVTIKGVTITDQVLGGTSDYLNFELNGAKAYIRTYVTDFPTTLKAEDKGTIDAFHAANRGNTADVTGILVLYSGAPYLIPMSVDCFTNVQQPERDDAQKAEFELSTITVTGKLTSDTTLTLPTVGGVYDNVAITWTCDNELVVIDGGNVTITIPDAATDITLTATAVCGSETKTATFTIKLSKELTSVSDAIAMGAGKEHNTYTDDKYLVGGIITEVYNETYGNMKITDEYGNILTIYGTYSADGSTRYDAMDVKPVAGDYVVVLGIIGQYSGTPQVKNGWIVTHKTTTSIEDANTLGGTFGKNEYTEDKYLVTGTVKEIQNATYGNIVIEDANGNSILVYGTYDSTGANRFDAMTTQPQVGDTVTVYGIVGFYSAPQLKNAWIVSITKGTSENPDCTEHVDADGDKKCDTCGADVPGTDDPVDPPKPADPTPDSTLTIAEVLALGASKEHNTYTEGKYYVTGVITEVYNTTYGNMKITDADGNILTIYGTYNADGSVRYDALESKPVAGDTVTVYGIVGQYSGTAQVKNGWITAHTPAAPVEPDEPEILDLSGTNGMCSPDTYRENGVVLKDGEADVWFAANRANNGISGVDNIGFRGWAFIGDGKTIAVADFGYALLKNGTEMSDITWGFAPLVDENLYAPLEGRVEVRRYDITIDLTGLEAGEYDVFLYVKDANGQIYHMSRWTDVWVKVEAPATPDEPEVKDTLTIPEALELGVANGDNTYTEEKYYVSGTVKSVYNATYGNMYIVDAEGNEITVYGTYSADGSARYDAMESKPIAGDTITVYGIVGNYNGTPQLKNAWIIEFTHEHNYADATCTEPKTCVCGATDGEPNGHNYVDGSCSACGAIDPDANVGGGDTTPVTASKTIAELITSEGWTSSTTGQSFKLDDIVSVKVDGGSNSGKAYNGDHIRIYATDTPAGTLTISVPEGYELVSVKVSAVTGTYAFLYVDGTTTDICNQTVNVSGNSVLLNSVKNGSNGKQVRVTAIEVVYQLAA